MFYTIAVPEAPYAVQTTALQGAVYHMTFQFNFRAQLWFWSIADAVGTPILSSVPMRTGRDLTGAYPQLPLPAGLFFVQDTTGQDADPGLTSFTSAHRFLFVDDT